MPRLDKMPNSSDITSRPNIRGFSYGLSPSACESSKISDQTFMDSATHRVDNLFRFYVGSR